MMTIRFQALFRWTPMVLVAVFCFGLACTNVRDYDLGFHLQTGAWIWEHKSFPTVDPFSHTLNGQPWPLQEGIPTLIFYGIERHFGIPGLIIFKALMLTLAYLGGGWLLAKRGVPPEVAAFTVFVAILMGKDRFFLRPYVISYVFLVVELHLLWEWRNGNRRWIRWAFMLFFPVWLSFHALAFHGFIVLGLSVIGEGVDKLIGRKKTDDFWKDWWCKATWSGLVVLLTVTAVGAFHSNGWAFMCRIVEIVSEPMSRTRILEMGSLYTIYGIKGPFIFMAGSGILFLVLAWRKVSAVDAVLFFAYVLFPIYISRFIAPSSLILCSIVGVWLMDAVNALRERNRLKNTDLFSINQKIIVGFVLLYVLVFGSMHLLSQKSRLGFGWDAAIYPAQAYDFIDRVNVPGEIYNDMFFGGTFIHRFYPERLVFIDGRTHYPEWFTEGIYGTVKRADPGWNSILEAYNVNTVLLHNERFLYLHYSLIGSPEWKKVYYAPPAVVYVRTDLVPAELQPAVFDHTR